MEEHMKVYARLYSSHAEARTAYEQAIRTYVASDNLEVGFLLGFVPQVGWLVVAVGRDASAGMLEGGEEFTLPEETRQALLRRFEAQRPSADGNWVIRRIYPEGLVVRTPTLH